MFDGDQGNEQWKGFVQKVGIQSIDIPYVVALGAVNGTGVFRLRDPFEESSTEGVVVGAVNGTYRLDRSNTEAHLYDPTGNLIRLVVVLNLPGKELRARIDTRRWDGKWDEGSWAILWRGETQLTNSTFAHNQALVAGEIQIPTAISGKVGRLEGMSYCMDGATHLIDSAIGLFRLKGRDKEVTKALDSASDKIVTIMGNPVRGAECGYILVYHVSNADQVSRALMDGSWVPFPL